MGVPVLSGAARFIYSLRVPRELRNARVTERNAQRRLQLVDLECQRLRQKRVGELIRSRNRVLMLEGRVIGMRRNPNIPVLTGAARMVYDIRRPVDLRAIDRTLALKRQQIWAIEKELSKKEKRDWKHPDATASNIYTYARYIDALHRAKKDLERMNELREAMESEHGFIASARMGNRNPWRNPMPIRDMGIVNYGPQSGMSAADREADFNDLNYHYYGSEPPASSLGQVNIPEAYPVFATGHPIYNNPRRGMNEFMRFAMEYRHKYHPGKHSFHENSRIMREAAKAYHKIHGNPGGYEIEIPFTSGHRKHQARTAFWGTAVLMLVYVANKMSGGRF